MTITPIESGSVTYFLIAAVIWAIDNIALRMLLTERRYHWAMLPATFLHELAHVVAAFCFGGVGTIRSLVPRRLEDGSFQLGLAGYEGVRGTIGRWVVNAAPMVYWLIALLIGLIYVYGSGAHPWYEAVCVMLIVYLLFVAGFPSAQDVIQGGLVSLVILGGFIYPSLVAGAKVLAGWASLLLKT